MVYVLLGDGFEEIEALAPVDLLRRAGIKVSTVTLTDELPVRGGHGITAQADTTLGQIDFGAMEMLVLPGGGGVATISDTPAAIDLIERAWESGKLIGAICAAPSILAALSLVDGKRVVCHPTVADIVGGAGAKLQPDLPAVRDGNLITGKSAGAAMDFSLELVAALSGTEASDDLRRAILYY